MSSTISLSLDGQTLAVGSIKNSDNGQESGHVRVYFGMEILGHKKD